MLQGSGPNLWFSIQSLKLATSEKGYRRIGLQNFSPTNEAHSQVSNPPGGNTCVFLLSISIFRSIIRDQRPDELPRLESLKTCCKMVRQTDDSQILFLLDFLNLDLKLTA